MEANPIERHAKLSEQGGARMAKFGSWVAAILFWVGAAGLATYDCVALWLYISAFSYEMGGLLVDPIVFTVLVSGPTGLSLWGIALEFTRRRRALLVVLIAVGPICWLHFILSGPKIPLYH